MFHPDKHWIEMSFSVKSIASAIRVRLAKFNSDADAHWEGKTLVVFSRRESMYPENFKAIADAHLGKRHIHTTATSLVVDFFGVHFYDADDIEIVCFQTSSCGKYRLVVSAALMRAYTNMELGPYTLSDKKSNKIIRIDGKWSIQTPAATSSN